MFEKIINFFKCLIRAIIVLSIDAIIFALLFGTSLGKEIVDLAKNSGFYGWYFWVIVIAIFALAFRFEYRWVMNRTSNNNRSSRPIHYDDDDDDDYKPKKKSKWDEIQEQKEKENEERRKIEAIEWEARQRLSWDDWNFDNDFAVVQEALRVSKDGRLIKELQAKMNEQLIKQRNK